MKKSKLLFITAVLALLCSELFAKGDTYIYDYWGQMEKSPDVYRVSSVLYADDLSLEIGMKKPDSLFAYGNNIYIVDTGNSRIIELIYNYNKTVSLSRVIDHFNTDNDSGIINTFNEPHDLFINEEGYFFIADTMNNRVVKLDSELNYVATFSAPDDPNYDKEKSFLPLKVVADSKGRTYILAQNVNKGFLKYEYDGSFSGFYGASEVVYNLTDYLWKKFSTRAQREQMESFVPTEYSNACMDKEGFIFAVTHTFDPWDLLSDKAKPVRRLNALGDDILVKNSENLPVGDLEYNNAAGIKGPSQFMDVTVLDNEVYIVIDSARGRLFGYNNQGYLLFAFGGRGNIDGYFRSPSSLEHIGKDLFVLDDMNASLTIFTPTEYGSLIYEATELYAEGKYNESADAWSKVLVQNGNYDLAYIGLGKASFRQSNYKQAMDYFRLKRDKRDYSKAFQYYRKEWIERNIGKVVIILLILIIVPFIIRKIKAFKKELMSL